MKTEATRNCVYLLRCADGTLYCGWTTDLAARVKAHNSGRGAKYTRSRLPAELVYYETYEDRHEALSREWHLKRLPREEKLALIRDAKRAAEEGRAVMLEKMDAFFEARLEGYEAHQLNCIESAREFYPFTASCLPRTAEAAVLDLGCGTGLELGYYFELVPTAKITGIDLSQGMLAALRRKFPGKSLNLIAGSYFDLPLEACAFDAALSVESLHHFTKEEKIPLYEKVRNALKPGGWLILTDYFARSDEEERSRRAELLRLKQEQGIRDVAFYHYDTPLTVEHETEALRAAGFSAVTVLKSWGQTFTLRANR